MIIGLGLDIIEIERLQGVFERHGDRFAERVFTVAELEQARSRPRTAITFYAGRWAAKEAVAKALGCGFGPDCGWRDIEVLNDALGKPQVTLAGAARCRAESLGICRLLLSISHEAHYAVANVVAEGR